MKTNTDRLLVVFSAVHTSGKHIWTTNLSDSGEENDKSVQKKLTKLFNKPYSPKNVTLISYESLNNFIEDRK
jgi:hypothetical protein